MDHDLTKRVLAALEQAGARYVVFGGVALNLHGLPRTTEALDIFIAPDRDNIERVKAALRDVFADPCIDEITAEDLLGEYPAVQYVPPSGNFHIDIITRLGELFVLRSGVRANRLRWATGLDCHPADAVPHEEGHRAPQGLGRC